MATSFFLPRFSFTVVKTVEEAVFFTKALTFLKKDVIVQYLLFLRPKKRGLFSP